MSDSGQWKALCAILQAIQLACDPSTTEDVFKQVLAAIRDRLRSQTFVYVVPARVSALQVDKLIEAFLSELSGGDRGLSVAAALFETLGSRFQLYSSVRRGVVNATDVAASAAADLECIGADGRVALAVEVKERRIGNADVQLAVGKAREHAVRELLLCTHGSVSTERDRMEDTVAKAWAAGTNVYRATLREMVAAITPLLGEAGLRILVVAIGVQLDRFSTQPRHRKAWKTLLDQL